MKKSLLAFLFTVSVLLMLVSCMGDSDNPSVNFHLEYVPVTSVDLPETMRMGQHYSINVYYQKPTSCYYFNGIYRQDDGYIYTTAVEAMVLENSNCEALTTSYPEVATFDFTVPSRSYDVCIFKFYTGTDDDGDSTFLVKQVPVTQ